VALGIVGRHGGRAVGTHQVFDPIVDMFEIPAVADAVAHDHDRPIDAERERRSGRIDQDELVRRIRPLDPQHVAGERRGERQGLAADRYGRPAERRRVAEDDAPTRRAGILIEAIGRDRTAAMAGDAIAAGADQHALHPRRRRRRRPRVRDEEQPQNGQKQPRTRPDDPKAAHPTPSFPLVQPA
jgi:hypothetical protein